MQEGSSIRVGLPGALPRLYRYPESSTVINESVINKWLKIIHKSFYPPICLICGSPGHRELDLCGICSASLPYNRICCKICGVSLPIGAAADLCGKCALKKPNYDSTRAMFVYAEPVRYLIRSLKFRANYSCARLLGLLMADHLRSIDAPVPELIIPVPLHRNRLQQRGFNQSIELARPLSKIFRIPMPLDLCIRRRDTAPQYGLISRERQKNIRNAFTVSRRIEKSHVAILDDVITTGCTVNELARILRRCGVEMIDVWSIARANLGGRENRPQTEADRGRGGT
jgi:ComF family protein